MLFLVVNDSRNILGFVPIHVDGPIDESVLVDGESRHAMSVGDAIAEGGEANHKCENECEDADRNPSVVSTDRKVLTRYGLGFLGSAVGRNVVIGHGIGRRGGGIGRNVVIGHGIGRRGGGIGRNVVIGHGIGRRGGGVVAQCFTRNVRRVRVRADGTLGGREFAGRLDGEHNHEEKYRDHAGLLSCHDNALDDDGVDEGRGRCADRVQGRQLRVATGEQQVSTGPYLRPSIHSAGLSNCSLYSGLPLIGSQWDGKF